MEAKSKTPNPLNFSDHADEIMKLINKRQNKWFKPVNWMDYDDVQMMILNHINKKWDQYDPKYPLANWVNRIISNQFRNIIRDCQRNNLFVYSCVEEDFRDENADAQVLDFDYNIEGLTKQIESILTPKEYIIFCALLDKTLTEEQFIDKCGYAVVYRYNRPQNNTLQSAINRIYMKIKKNFELGNLDIF